MRRGFWQARLRGAGRTVIYPLTNKSFIGAGGFYRYNGRDSVGLLAPITYGLPLCRLSRPLLPRLNVF